MLSKEYDRWQRFIEGAENYNMIAVDKLLSKPLVIAFYSQLWKENGVDFLMHLNDIQDEVKATGGNLLVITDVREASFDKIVWDNNLSLNFYHDADKEIATDFGICNNDIPVWEHYTDVDVNAPLLAVYVISLSKKIIYEHADRQLSGFFPAEEIITAVYRAGSYSDKCSA